MPHIAALHLGLHCLQVFNLCDFRQNMLFIMSKTKTTQQGFFSRALLRNQLIRIIVTPIVTLCPLSWLFHVLLNHFQFPSLQALFVRKVLLICCLLQLCCGVEVEFVVGHSK